LEDVAITRRKLGARTLQVLTLGPKGMYGDHAAGCTDALGCDPTGLASPTCDVGEALHRLAFRGPKHAGALPRLQAWFTREGRLVNGARQ
jgi:hypothetical protein